ncbi:MAG: DUF4340 domain-containing protein [Flavobacteriales bacterium]
MKKHHFLILFALIAVGYLIYHFMFDKEQMRFDRQDFKLEHIDRVDKISISSRAPETTVLTKKGDQWFANETYIARPELMKYLLQTLSKMEIKHRVTKSRKDRVYNELATMKLTVDIYEDNTLLKTIYVGNNTPDNLGTYMMLKGSTEPYAMHIPGFTGYLRSRFIAAESTWRSTQIFNVDGLDIEELSMEYPNQTEQNYRIKQEGDVVELFDYQGNKKESSTLELKQYLSKFKKIYHEGFVKRSDPVQPKNIKNLPEIFKLSIKEKGKEAIVLTSFQKGRYQKSLDNTHLFETIDKDRLYATDGRDFFVIQYYVFEPLMKQLTDFYPSQNQQP